MTILNAIESSDYFDRLADDRERSAVIVIHNTWLDHSSTLRSSPRLTPESPLDMLVLYKAAAATFSVWLPGISFDQKLTEGGRIINRLQAQAKLEGIADSEIFDLTLRLANNVIALSENSTQAQDLEFYVDLFLKSTQDKRTINSIVSGVISQNSTRLANDPNSWR